MKSVIGWGIFAVGVFAVGAFNPGIHHTREALIAIGLVAAIYLLGVKVGADLK